MKMIDRNEIEVKVFSHNLLFWSVKFAYLQVQLKAELNEKRKEKCTAWLIRMSSFQYVQFLCSVYFIYRA